MLNHARTLLLNRVGTAWTAGEVPGEEAVTHDYLAVALPTYLNVLRSRLFGSDPDRAMLNYRLAQFMPLLHATELVEYVTALDPRVSYVDHDNQTLFADATFAPTQQHFGGPPTAVSFQGGPAAPDGPGRLRHELLLEVAGTTATLTQRAPRAKSWILTLAFTSGWSARIDMGDSGYGLLVPQGNATYLLRVLNRPQRPLPKLLAQTEQCGEPVFLSLFGAAPAEPYRTFRNLYFDHDELAYRLGGLLLAMAYRTDEIRRGVARG